MDVMVTALLVAIACALAWRSFPQYRAAMRSILWRLWWPIAVVTVRIECRNQEAMADYSRRCAAKGPVALCALVAAMSPSQRRRYGQLLVDTLRGMSVEQVRDFFVAGTALVLDPDQDESVHELLMGTIQAYSRTEVPT